MRFLVDECLSVEVAERLVTAGHDAVHVGARGLLGRSDEDVMATAATEGRVLLSADTDFGEMLALGGAPRPSVVLFRRQGRTAQVQVAVLLENLPTVKSDLEHGALVVLQQDTVRVRSLPIDRRH